MEVLVTVNISETPMVVTCVTLSALFGTLITVTGNGAISSIKK